MGLVTPAYWACGYIQLTSQVSAMLCTDNIGAFDRCSGFSWTSHKASRIETCIEMFLIMFLSASVEVQVGFHCTRFYRTQFQVDGIRP